MLLASVVSLSLPIGISKHLPEVSLDVEPPAMNG